MLNVFLLFLNSFLLCLFFLAGLIPQLLQKSQKLLDNIESLTPQKHLLVASNLSVVLGKNAAADILGHDVRMLMKHYRRAMSVSEAEELLCVTPLSLGLCD